MPALSTLSRVTGLPSGAALLAAQPAGSGQGFVEVTPAQADVVAWLSFTPVSMTQLTAALAGVGSTYTLPAATTSTLGGVKPDGTTITISAGIISAAGGGGSYTLPQATTTVLGGVLAPHVVQVDGATIAASTGTPYVMQPNDRVVDVNKTTGAATALTLPSAPMLGVPYQVFDGKGDAQTNNITLTVPGTSTTFVMNLNGDAYTLYAITATLWRVG